MYKFVLLFIYYYYYWWIWMTGSMQKKLLKIQGIYNNTMQKVNPIGLSQICKWVLWAFFFYVNPLNSFCKRNYQDRSWCFCKRNLCFFITLNNLIFLINLKYYIKYNLNEKKAYFEFTILYVWFVNGISTSNSNSYNKK